MSDEDSDNPRVKEDPLPNYKVRFTDMADDLVIKAVKCKYRLN